MIFDGVLGVLKAVLVFTLSPLTVVNISVDWFTSFDSIQEFFTVISYLLPWDNLSRLFVIVFAIISFKIVISIVKTFRAII